MAESKYKLAYLVSHPIQYQAPLLRYIAERSNIDLTVFFLSDFSLRAYEDKGFGRQVTWDVPLVEGYKYVVLPSIGPNNRVTPIRPFVYGLSGHLRRGKFDAVWLHGYAHIASVRTMILAKMLGMSVFLRTDSHAGKKSLTPIHKMLKRPVLKALFRLVDVFLVAGKLNADYFMQYGVPEGRMQLMPYAVDNDYFQSRLQIARPEREALRAELGLLPGRPVILFAGKLVPQKRCHDLIDAYARLSPDGTAEPNPYLVLIGEGAQRAELEQRAAAFGWNSIKFPGFKNQSELPGYYDLCDVFVLPSDNEAWGLVVNEAMNAAKPVIVTRGVGCWPDLVGVDGNTGYVIDAGDIEALADRLGRLTESRDLAREMGDRAFQLISKWGFAENVAALEEALARSSKNGRSLERAQNERLSVTAD